MNDLHNNIEGLEAGSQDRPDLLSNIYPDKFVVPTANDRFSNAATELRQRLFGCWRVRSHSGRNVIPLLASKYRAGVLFPVSGGFNDFVAVQHFSLQRLRRKLRRSKRIFCRSVRFRASSELHRYQAQKYRYTYCDSCGVQHVAANPALLPVRKTK